MMARMNLMASASDLSFVGQRGNLHWRNMPGCFANSAAPSTGGSVGPFNHGGTSAAPVGDLSASVGCA